MRVKGYLNINPDPITSYLCDLTSYLLYLSEPVPSSLKWYESPLLVGLLWRRTVICAAGVKKVEREQGVSSGKSVRSLVGPSFILKEVEHHWSVVDRAERVLQSDLHYEKCFWLLCGVDSRKVGSRDKWGGCFVVKDADRWLRLMRWLWVGSLLIREPAGFAERLDGGVREREEQKAGSGSGKAQ